MYLLFGWDDETIGEGVELTETIPDAEWWGEPDDIELLGKADMESADSCKE